MKKIATLMLAVLMVFGCLSLVACGGDKNDVTGIYKFDSMKMGDEEIKVGAEMGGMTFTEDFIVLEMKKDNTFVMTNGGADNKEEGTWEEKDGSYILTVEDVPMTATIKDGVLTFEVEGEKVVLKKK